VDLSDGRQTEGMGMSIRASRRGAQAKEEHAKQKLVPYKLASYEHDHEGKRIKSSKVVFSFWSASKYVLILSLMLWWLPMFGQMIAGYVGGRRAGGPWKGVIAAIVPVVCLYAVMTGFDSGLLPSHMFGVAIAPAAIGASLNHNVPFISPYLQFSSEYIGSFVNGLAGSSPYGINTYVLTVAFAYVGGVLAAQNRREIEFTAGGVTSSTTVLVHDNSAFSQPAVVEERAPARGVFAAGISGLLHWPGHGAAKSAGYVPRRHGDPWASAAEMHYAEEEQAIDERYMLPQARGFEPSDYGAYRTRPREHMYKENRHGDPWKQKRRGRPNLSSKPRFRYAQYEDQPVRTDNGNYGGGPSRRSKVVPRFTVSPDPRSIKRAKRIIDNDWGRRNYPSFSEAAVADDDEGSVAADPIVHQRKEHHTGHNWDTI